MENEKKHYSVATFLLGFSMLATGACGLVCEYVLSTVSSYILGNSIEQFSVVIALMMLMMGIASYAQRFLGDENLVEKFVIVEIFLALLGGFAPISIYAAFGLMEDHFALVQYFFVSAIGLMIGFEIPIILRINEKYSDTLRVNLARIVSFDYIGSFVGLIIWLYLLRRLPLTKIGFAVAGINFAIATITFAYFMRMGLVKHKVVASCLIPVTALLLVFGWQQSAAWEINLEQRLYNDRIVFSKTTKYQRLVMTHDPAINDYRFYINGNLQFSSVDEAVYHELLVHPAMALASVKKRVLILGGGDGMALREVLKYREVESVTLVDLDPGMTAFCATNPTLAAMNNNSFRDARVKAYVSRSVYSSGRRPVYVETDAEMKKGKFGEVKQVEKTADVEIFNVDADKFIGEINGNSWDVVIVDFPDPNAVELAKLYSKEFYLKLQRVLSPDGIFVVQSTSPYHAKEAYLCIMRTIKAAGYAVTPYHENVPSFGDWGWVIGWRNDQVKGFAEKIHSLTFNVPTKYLTPEAFGRSMIFGKGALESTSQEINTLMWPVLLDYYLRDGWKVD